MLIDFTLTATRRADLLARTLQSLESHLFPHFEVVNAFVNIDPIYGEGDVVPMVEGLPGKLHVTQPEKADHATAVKTVWSETIADIVLHWEDDYELLEAVTPEDLKPLVSGRVAIMPVWHDEKRDPQPVRREWKWKSPAGPSPRFMTGEYTRGAAELLMPGYCPEKQATIGRPRGETPVNRALYNYARGFKARYLLPKQGRVLARHLGRDWNETHGIEVHIEGGRCIRTGL